eukprot:CAMPEP_0119015298 /NCGR_PEP_ID=MMETSP1176-20130426/10768_1 /TAXON_ID=265551 /ORGANISM="Synedropsis recta cf, Strain CCMP1620" /LENGTH=252 /DNA_ID=CAMNT_0006968577 /DNA_START=68 /DNA_END=826 /DNA_ORIENTATION=-
MTTMFLLRTITLFSLIIVSSANCNSALCIEGNCIDGDCQCLSGYIGDDCSIPFKICEGGDRSCFNGSECQRNNERDPVTLKYKYHCDCSKAFGLSSFAGQQCEYSATSTCQRNVAVSESTFCTNGGDCVETVSAGDDHQGCLCAAEFEGLHCQYLAGEAPPEELAAVQALQEMRSRNDSIGGIALFFIIVIPLILIAMFVFFVWKKRTTGKEYLGDVTFGEDGGGDLAGEVEIQAGSSFVAEDGDATVPDII